MGGLVQQKKLIANEISWLRELREAGLSAFEKVGVPIPKSEYWKYTKPRDLNADDFVMETSQIVNLELREPELLAYKIYFVNGVFCPQKSDLPSGVEVVPLIEAIMLNGETRRYLGKLVELDKNPFAALNSAYINEGVFIKIEKNVNLKKPLMIVNHSQVGAENLFYNLRNLIILEEGSSAEFVEVYTYSGELKSRYFANIVNEIFVGRNSTLNHYKLQDEAFKANHVAYNIAEVKSGGSYNNFCLQKGANIGRNEVKVLLKEEQARTNINAAYIMSGWATIDNTTDVEHQACYTYSNQLVKGVVDGDSKGVFQGKIHIDKDAIKTEGQMLHRALLLSDTAEIDVKPELEIFADDVKCSHGAASGELDENQLFYMQSRGIDEDEARRILVEAFLDDVIYKIENEAIRTWFKNNV